VVVIKASSHSNHAATSLTRARLSGALRRIQVWAAVIAWMLATGSHWDVVQAFAWGRMIYGYSHTMTVAESVKRTFAPGNMCKICRLVNQARKSQESNPAAQINVGTKISLHCPPVPHPVVASPASASWLLGDPVMPATERAAPPLPPPRFVAA